MLLISLFAPTLAADTGIDASEPLSEEIVEEDIDIMFRWKNETTGEHVRGWTTIHLAWSEDDSLAEGCKRRWGQGWCGVGEFRTDDRGTGTAEFSVTRDRWRRLRTVSLVYDDTGALYEGDLLLKRVGETYLGVMALASDPAWVGVWDEPLRVEAEKRKDRVSKR